MAQYWGELFPTEELADDFVEELIEKCMKPVPLRLYQPSEEKETDIVELPPECSTMDSMILHTIKLLRYERLMKDYISKFKSERKSGKDLKPPEFPEDLDRKPFHAVSYPFRHMERITTPFVEGVGTPSPRLNETTARKILQKCVATLFAHIGFECTSKAILNIMTDISEEYILKFTSMLRFAFDEETTYGKTGFPDIVERVFHEMGIGSMLSLHEFYQQRVILYHERVLKKCCKLAAEYSSLTTPAIKEEIMGELLAGNMKGEEVEVEEEEADVPELHVPAGGDGYTADKLQHSLESGFQMLHSLEQEEHLQNLEQEEEIANTHLI